MKKKYLNEGRDWRAERRNREHSEFISLDQVNRYMLQMSDEELEAIKSWRELIAKILGTKPENIEWLKRDPKSLGYRVKIVGDMDDLEKIMDNNVGTLKRLKGAEEEEKAEEFVKITDRGTFENFMKKYVNGEWTLDIKVDGKPVDVYDTKGKGICLDTSVGRIYTKLIKGVDIKRTGNSWEGWIEANGFKSRFNAELWEDEDEENDERENLMTDGEGADTNKDGWMSPEDMGIAQKIDWADDNGNEISHDEKMAYFQDLSDKYEVDNEKDQVRLKPEEEWFPMDDDMDDDMEDWEREGYNSEIAYQNRWRDYRD